MRLPLIGALGAGLIVFATIAPQGGKADPRPFTFVYDTYPVGKGNGEYEQWLTLEHKKEDDSGYNALRLRHEFEFGIADNFDLSVYVASWRYEDSKEFTGTQFESSSVEGILYLSNPATDFIGSALYLEGGVGEDELELEFKVLLQKDFGNWTVAYNLVLETELEGVFNSEEENEVEGILGHAIGVSYAFTPQFSVGAEAVIESVYEDWSDYEHTTAYVGPKISYYSGNHWWVTMTGMAQVTNVGEEPDFQVRMIAGYEW